MVTNPNEAKEEYVHIIAKNPSSGVVHTSATGERSSSLRTVWRTPLRFSCCWRKLDTSPSLCLSGGCSQCCASSRLAPRLAPPVWDLLVLRLLQCSEKKVANALYSCPRHATAMNHVDHDYFGTKPRSREGGTDHDCRTTCGS